MQQVIEAIYSITLKVTKDTRLAIFQLKIVHDTCILPTNATLFEQHYSTEEM